MPLFGKSKPTAPFHERRVAWALYRGASHQPRPLGYYASLIAEEKLPKKPAPENKPNQEVEFGLRLFFQPI